MLGRIDHTLAGRPGGLDHHEFMSLKRKTAYSPSPPSFYGRGEEEDRETKKARKLGEEEEEKERSRVEAEEETKRSRKARTAFSDAQLREDINTKD